MKRKQSWVPQLTVVYPNAAGIDVGGSQHYVCVPPGRDVEVVRSFGAFTVDLVALADWLDRCGVRQVAMEATGVYWIPLFELLERRGFEVFLVNGRQTRQVAGRKSDVRDCQWIQQLMMFGLLHASFRPADRYCALRAVVRLRAQAIRSAVRAVQQMDKALVQMNVQLGRLLADLGGQSGLAIIRAILAGERDGTRLAALCDRRVRTPQEVIAQSLVGNWRDEHLLALRFALGQHDLIQQQIAQCDQEIERYVSELQCSTGAAPVARKVSCKTKRHTAQAITHLRTLLFHALQVDLTAIAGIEVDTALVLLAEVGTDYSRFPSSQHFCSWLNLAPGTRISGGKRLGRAPMPGINRAAEALKRAAINLRHDKGFLGAAHRARLARMPKACAIKASAHQLARLIYAMVTKGQAYVERGLDELEAERRQAQVRKLLRQASQLGYDVIERSEPTKEPASTMN